MDQIARKTVGLKCKLTWRIKMDIFHFNIKILFSFSFHFLSRPSLSISFISFIFSQIFNFLSLITSSSDVRFSIRQILWLTHNIYFRETVPDSQICHCVLHFFLRTILGSMKENQCFLCPDYTSTGALKLEMRSVFLISLFYSAIFSIYLGLIDLHAIKFK